MQARAAHRSARTLQLQPLSIAHPPTATLTTALTHSSSFLKLHRQHPGGHANPGHQRYRRGRFIAAAPLPGATPTGRPVSGQVRRRELLLGSVVVPCAACASCARVGWYDKYFAYAMRYGMANYEETIAPVKAQLFDQLLSQGGVSQLLEIGMGTGPNLAYYASVEGIHVTGLDPNPQMAPYAREAAEELGLGRAALTLLEGSAEAMPLEDGSMDAVACTLVLCSVRSQEAVLKEVARVLRPGGAFLFIEHVLAPPDRRLQRLGQRLLNPLQNLAADGCNLNRNTLGTIKGSGLFREVDAREFEVEGLGPIAPHVAGIALKA